MANIEKGRNKREHNTDEYTHDYRLKDDLKAFRRGKPQIEIYRPGSGPLRKSAQGEEENIVFVDNSRKFQSSADNSQIMNSHENYHDRRNHSTSQEQLIKSKITSSNRDIDQMTGSIGNLSISSHSGGNRGRRNSLGNISSNVHKSGGNESRKKGKKPEQPIYVPKGVAQAQAERETSNRSPKYDLRDIKINGEENWDEDCSESKKEPEMKNRIENGPNTRKNKSDNNRKQGNNRAKDENVNSHKRGENRREEKSSRFGSGKRRGQESNWVVEAQQQQNQQRNQRSTSRENRLNSDPRSQPNAHRQGSSSREIRQGSEPRPVTLPNSRQNANAREIRQTSEPPRDQRGNWNQSDKVQSKPPSGRRGSGKDGKVYPCLDSLPPRLRRKYLVDQGLVPGPPRAEDLWDGSTVTFKGSSNAPSTPGQQQQPPTAQQYTAYHQQPPGPLQQTFHPPMAFHPAGPGGFHPSHPAHYQQNWSHTLPGPRSSGREMTLAAARFSRSLTPERVALVPSPPTQSSSLQHNSGNFNRTTSQDNLAHPPPLLQPSSVSAHQDRRTTTTLTQERSTNNMNSWDSERPKQLVSHNTNQSMPQHPTISNKMAHLPPNSSHLQPHPQTQNMHYLQYNQQQSIPSHQQVQHPNQMQSKQESQQPRPKPTQNHTPQQPPSLEEHQFKKPATPPPLPIPQTRNTPSPKILAWSEEIEASERQEAEERLSRPSTSPPSLLESRVNSGNHREGNSGSGKRRRRDKRRNHGGGGGGSNAAAGHQNDHADNRSLSRNRQGGRAHNSLERNSGRQISSERNASGGGGNQKDASNSYQFPGGGRRDFSNERNNSRERKFRRSSRDRYRGPNQEEVNFRNGSRERCVGLYRNQSRERSGATQQESWRKSNQPPIALQQNGRKETNATREVDNNKEKQENVIVRKESQDSRANRDNVSLASNSNAKEREIRDGNISNASGNSPGILILPPQPTETPTYTSVVSASNSSSQSEPYRPPQIASRHLYDPNNPDKPIVVPTPCSRVLPSANQEHPSSPMPPALPGFSPTLPGGFQHVHPTQSGPENAFNLAEQFGNNRPSWYDPYSKSFRSAKSPHLLLDIERADMELSWILSQGDILREWNKINYIRDFLQKSLSILIVTDLKFCQTENVEQHFWKILFYNLIELLRNLLEHDKENKEKNKSTLLTIIDEGTIYLEKLLESLETTYKFKLEDYFIPSIISSKTLGFVSLALVSAQKLYLFLGDLARYKEQINETTNFGKSRQMYMKAHQMNPKNGRPYNQLAILAVYARRKLDAVYYYMRSLMASNPFHSARESLLLLFDESRKKFEQWDRKRREEREAKMRAYMAEKEGSANSIRREKWIHPNDGQCQHITTDTAQETQRLLDDFEDLAGFSGFELNKRFVTSYLHVHGKLFTKIGMESFQEAAIQMLREFRTLLQHSPIPLNANRFLQLLALNMFSIENTQLKDTQLGGGYRSAVQENALVVSLQMFNLILERCVNLLKEQLDAQHAPEQENGRHAADIGQMVSQDLRVLLPALKVWCDWLLCHRTVWNPPPSCADYHVGPSGDAWMRIASLVNLLEKLDLTKTELLTSQQDGYELVRLPEDATLCGFTPLMYNINDPFYIKQDSDMEMSQVVLRIRKILFFGTEFLCGVDPPVLKLQKFDTFSEYISVVRYTVASQPESTTVSPTEGQSDTEDLGQEDNMSRPKDLNLPIPAAQIALQNAIESASRIPNSPEIHKLLKRKAELELRQKCVENRRQHLDELLRDAPHSVEIEVRPHYLVPDTNCFIDYLESLQLIANKARNYYTLMVPLVVFKELEGLARGGRDREVLPLPAVVSAEHAAKVATAARQALTYLRSRALGVRCVTTQGTVISITTRVLDEEDTQTDFGAMHNDDRILTTCLNICKTYGKTESSSESGEPSSASTKDESGRRHVTRVCVLLTEDRNLRVKALVRDMPVRPVPAFLAWAGLG